MNSRQIRLWIVRPILEYLAPEIPNSYVAQELLMGTAAQESNFQYVDQIGDAPGPAFGLWQMEKATHDDHIKWLAGNKSLERKVQRLEIPAIIQPNAAIEMHGNLYYAAALCRIHYWRVPEPLPSHELEDLARYWKKYYNTHLGKGTTEEFIHNFQEYVR